MSITELFASRGEAEFRTLERAELDAGSRKREALEMLGEMDDQAAESLDAVFAEEIDPALNLDAVESKLFGIGSESYVVGSHEFYLGYAITRKKLLCLDAGPDGEVIMSIAIIVSGVLMIALAERVSTFLARNRMYEVLGLFILFIVPVHTGHKYVERLLLGEGPNADVGALFIGARPKIRAEELGEEEESTTGEEALSDTESVTSQP